MSDNKLSHNQDLVKGFIAGSMASCMAVNFTNPIEIVKIRMQLQGEMGSSVKPSCNSFRSLENIYKKEGIRALQKGLGVAYVYQMGLNGSRLGFYDPVRIFLNSIFYPLASNPKSLQVPAVNVLAGTITGAIGAYVASPLYLIKTRIQSISNVETYGASNLKGKNVGALRGLVNIYMSEGGISGLFRGSGSAVMRTSVGSAVQLPVYNMCKDYFSNNFSFLKKDSKQLYLLSSFITGICVAVAMNPFDVVLTRIYNQNGDLYKGPLDCFIKMWRLEGWKSFGKGLGPAIFRLAPHTVLMITFLEYTIQLVNFF